MMPEERDQLAAEYVLGTLSLEERAGAEALLASDPAFAAAVARWQDRLAPLDDATPPVAPSASLWRRIEAAIDVDHVVAHPAPAPRPAPVVTGEAPRADPNERLADSAGPGNVIDLGRRMRRWRTVAAGMTAIAASLAAVVILDRLPGPPTDGPGRYVAVVTRDGSLPALLVDVDTAAGLVTVRTLAAEQPADRSLELWAVPEGQQPISLGLIDPNQPVMRIRPDRAGVIPTRGAFAVSVEPVGGSPTGAPTGPVVYSGALVSAAE